MKRDIILIAFLALTIAVGSAAGQSKQTRNLSGFNKVSFGVAGNLYVKLGDNFNVVLEGDDDVLDEVKTEVSGGRLVIKRENHYFNMNNDKVNVYVTMPEMEGLGVSGSGKAEIQDNLKSADLNLSVSGSGKLYTADLDVNNLHCSISGSGDIIVRGGNIGTGDLSISGSGNYEGEAAEIGTASVSISGSGNCTCNVTDNLKGGISGSGNVTYSGNPKVDVRVSGSGKFRSR
jgi:hypothetical protein